ncbi:MAG: EscU/YscU/HrcU family type III secretion system export apparatus switch protein [Bacillota bacterium]
MDKDQKKAAALEYNIEKDNAPKIVASGKGDIAKKILEKAEEENIKIEKDQDLAEILVQMEIGEEIPPELYEVIAEILAFIYNLEEL